MTQTLAPTSDVALPLAKPARLLSLDVFRGATVAAMILVNNPGSWGAIYWPLGHASWHGITPTDLIMPFFLFIVGVSITYAMDSGRADASRHGSMIGKACRRAAVLFALGVFMAFFPATLARAKLLFSEPLTYLHDLRIMGVLQRIAIVYLACVVLFLKGSPRAWITWSAVILVGYWAALTFVPVPASLTAAATVAATAPSTAPAAAPAVTGWVSANLEAGSNLIRAVDVAVLGESHMYQPTVAGKKVAFDPEGLLSTVAAVASGLAGVWAGWVLKKSAGPVHTRLATLYTAGTLCSVAAFAWGMFHPLNKQLWTGSYALLCTGLALTTLAACYHLWDAPPSVEGSRRWRPPTWLTVPLAAYGVNAITAFFVSGLMGRAMNLVPLYAADGKTVIGLKGWLYTHVFTPNITDPHLASLAWALCFVALWTGILLVMYRLKWIIKV